MQIILFKDAIECIKISRYQFANIRIPPYQVKKSGILMYSYPPPCSSDNLMFLFHGNKALRYIFWEKITIYNQANIKCIVADSGYRERIFKDF